MPETLKRLFTLDSRSLAVCRILTGLVIIGDLISRSLEFTLHYTNVGILPLAKARELGLIKIPTIYGINDTPVFVASLLLLHALLALGLSLGYRTRLMTILCWYFGHSLMGRNYLVNNGGDAVLVTLLFWAIFVPWGRAWSLDSLASRDQAPLEQSLYSMGTLCFVTQAFIMYESSVIHKMEPSWLQGKALYYAFSSDLYSRPISNYLLAYPKLLVLGTYSALAFEFIGPFLLFVRNQSFRLGLCGAFFLLHFGFGVFLRVGIFMWTPCLVFIALLPPKPWGPVSVTPELRSRLAKLARGLKAKPSAELSSKWTVPFLIFLLSFSMVKSLENHVLQTKWVPEVLSPVSTYTGLTQRWSVFVYLPRTSDHWFQVPATLSDGTIVDLFQGRDPLTWDRPLVVSEKFGHFRWPTPMLVIATEPEHRIMFIEALVKLWEKNHPDRMVKEARFISFTERTLPDYRDFPPVSKILYVWKEKSQ